MERDIHESNTIATESMIKFMTATAKKVVEMGLLTPATETEKSNSI